MRNDIIFYFLLLKNMNSCKSTSYKIKNSTGRVCRCVHGTVIESRGQTNLSIESLRSNTIHTPPEQRGFSSKKHHRRNPCEMRDWAKPSLL